MEITLLDSDFSVINMYIEMKKKKKKNSSQCQKCISHHMQSTKDYLDESRFAKGASIYRIRTESAIHDSFVDASSKI